MSRTRRGVVMTRSKRARIALVIVAAAAGLLAATAAARTDSRAAGTPIVIGWAFDGKGSMAPFDGPALAAAQLRVKQWNAKGGVDGRPLADHDVRHAGQQACDREGVRRQAASAAARTSSSRPATSTSPRRSCRSRSTRACSPSHRASAPTRWARSASAPKGKLAFSFGNVAQDEGSAMAQYAWGRGWRTAALATDTRHRLLQERRAGVHGPLEAARRQDRRPGDVPVARQHQRAERRQPPGREPKADVIVTSTAGAFGALSTLVSGLRSARATTRRSSTRGPATGRTGCRRARR